MSEWLTVYCTRPVARLAAADLSAFLRAADLDTAAEAFGLDDESVVDAAVALLEVIESPGDDASSSAPRLRVRYTDRPAADVVVHLWSDPVGVGTECAEALEELGEAHPATARSAAVRTGLDRTVEVVGIELPWAAEDMGFVLAVQCANHFTRAGDGLLRDQDHEWWAVLDGVLTRLE